MLQIMAYDAPNIKKALKNDTTVPLYVLAEVIVEGIGLYFDSVNSNLG